MTTRTIATLFVLGALTQGCAAPHAAEVRHSANGKEAQPVRVHAVAPAAPTPGVRYSASIEPYEAVTLSFKASGYVDDLLRLRDAGGLRAVQAGDLVTKGAVLARVRDVEYRDRLAQGRARLAEGEAAQRKARLDLDRATALFTTDSLTKPDLDAAQAAFDGAAARVAAAEADVALALTALRDCALMAPASGVLLERKVDAGALVVAGTAGFVLGDVRTVKARFGVPDSIVQTIAIGEPIAVSVDALSPTPFAGRISAIAPAADPQSRVFDIEVAVANSDGRLRPGMIGTVALGAAATTSSADAPLTAPLTAIVRPRTGNGQYAVLVIERRDNQNVATLRAVQLGEVLGNGVAILSGLKRGDRIVVSGAALLADGDPVRIVS